MNRLVTRGLCFAMLTAAVAATVDCGGSSDSGPTGGGGSGQDGGSGTNRDDASLSDGSTSDGSSSDSTTSSPLPDGSSSDGSNSGDATSGNDGDGGSDASDASLAPDALILDASDDASVAIPPYLRTSPVSSFIYTANFGSPYDSILAAPIEGLQSAIAPGYTTAPVAGQVSENYLFQEIDSSQDLYNALNVSASLSVSSGLFSASAKMSYAQSKTVDTTKLTIFLDATAGGLTEQIQNPQLTASAKALTPAAFYANYGDRYASEIITGEEIFGTIEIQTLGEDDKRSLATSLKLSYGASTVSANYSSTFESIVQNREVTIDFHTLGFTTDAGIDDAESFIDTVVNFASYASSAPNTSAQTLQLLYTTYYGLDGYPGVPAGTDTLVTQHAAAVSDYMLYNSLLTVDFAPYLADPNYSGNSFLTGMQTYRNSLSSYLSSSLTNSQGSGTPPTAPAGGTIAAYTVNTAVHTPSEPTTTATGPTVYETAPWYVTHTLANNFVPKRLYDYEIPLRYTHGGSTLEGATFSPVQPNPTTEGLTLHQPVTYELYLVDKTVYPNPQYRVLSYAWDTGTYFFSNVTTGGLPDDTLIPGQIDSLTINDYEHASADSNAEFVLINKANGLVLTDEASINSANYQMMADHFNAATVGGEDGGVVSIVASTAQLFEFVVGGCGGSTTPWTPSNASSTVVYATSVKANGALWWDIDDNWTSAGTEVGTYKGQCDDEQTYYLLPSDSGNDVAIQSYSDRSNYVMPNLTQVQTNEGAASSTSYVPEPIVIGAINTTGDDNQLWVLVSSANVDTTP